MRRDVKALIWEEFRVGGILSAFCLVFGIVFLLQSRYFPGSDAWARDSMLLFYSVLGTPLLVSLLLILNPNYSGHLTGGFSVRVLLLPVPTRTAVGCALASRTAFVSIVSVVLVGMSRALFDPAPSWTVACLLIMFYLAAQTIDWVRKFITGLSSLILLLATTLILFLLGPAELSDLRFAATPSRASLPISSFSLAGLAALAYAAGVFAVTKSRMGKQVGIPEIWEWPRGRFASRTGSQSGTTKPFTSPLSAQVWFELRRSFWFLPVWTAILSVLILVALWFYREEGEVWLSSYLSGIASYLILIAFLGVAAVQGVRSRVIGFRSTSGDPGYDHLQPMTTGHLVNARTIASALVLVPTFICVALLHFAVTVGPMLLDQDLSATSSAAYSLREVVWALFARSVLIGLAAWLFLAIGMRLFRWTVPAITGVIVIVAVFGRLLNRAYLPWESIEIVDTLLTIAVLLLAAITLCVFLYAVLQGLMSTKSAALWGVVWIVSTWVLYQTTVFASAGHVLPFTWHAMAGLSSFGWAAMIPLPHALALMDVRKRRHSASPTQRTIFGGRDPALTRALGVVLVTATVLLAMTVPSTPSFEREWHSRDYPVGLQELDEWYLEAPLGNNMALEYQSIVQREARLSGEFWYVGDNLEQKDGDVLIVGRGNLERGTPIREDSWKATEEYWEDVTSHIAPELREAAARDFGKSRYPIDLLEGYAVRLHHLAPLRSLARELSIDSLHWTLAGEPGKAIDSILAINSLADSLAQEPILISQLVRIALYGIEISAIEEILNRSVPSDADLAKLQDALASALPPLEEPRMVERGLIGAMAQGLSYRHGLPNYTKDSEDIEMSAPAPTVWQFIYPASLERLATAAFYDDLQRHSTLLWSEFRRWNDEEGVGSHLSHARFVAPFSAILYGSYSRVYDSEWRVRTQFDIARTSAGVERYRLKTGALPESLNDLVPDFLPEVPEDFYAGQGEQLRYRPQNDFEFVVYSVGNDMEDDQGVEMKDSWREGDQTFTVAPLTFRTGSQILAVPTE